MITGSDYLLYPAGYRWGQEVITFNIEPSVAYLAPTIRNVIAMWDAASELDFVEVPANGNVRFTEFSGNFYTAKANIFISDADMKTITGGEVLIGPNIADRVRWAIAHEFGHIMGLKHPYRLDLTPASQAPHAPAGSATPENTIMNYYEAHDGNLGHWDRQAINAFYGPETDTIVSDTIYGGDSSTTITVGPGFDLVFAGAGNDIVYGGADNDTLYGDAGNDLIYAGNGYDHVYGGAGDDVLFGDNLNDTLFGGTGNDNISGGAGYDVVYGGSENDVVYGNTENDTLYGESGNDILYGGKGYDILYGGDGNDTLSGDADHDTMYGGDGKDHFIIAGHDTIGDYEDGETFTFPGMVTGQTVVGSDLVVYGNGFSATLLNYDNLLVL